MSAQEVFDAISAAIASDANTVKVVNGIFHFKIDGKSWTIDLKNPPGVVKSGAPATADVTITIAEPDFVNLMTGKAKGQQLFMAGKLKIQG
jgi:alkyl sulfatase BDS1-like metallo-beta-lactamase superfamily hydrolase